MKGLKRTDICPGNLSNQKYESKMNMIHYYNFIRNAKATNETISWKTNRYTNKIEKIDDEIHSPINSPTNNDRTTSPKSIKINQIILPKKTTHRQTYQQKIIDESNELLASRLQRIQSAKRHRKKYDHGRTTFASPKDQDGEFIRLPTGLTHDNGRTVIDCYQAIHNSNDIYKEIHGAANDYVRVQKKINEENQYLYNQIVNSRSAYPKVSHDKHYQYHHRVRGLLSKQPEELVHLKTNVKLPNLNVNKNNESFSRPKTADKQHASFKSQSKVIQLDSSIERPSTAPEKLTNSLQLMLKKLIENDN